MAELTMQHVDPYGVGLYDTTLSGWYNEKQGCLMTGFPVGGDDVVVDVGSGDGAAALFCARQGAQVILCDIDAERLKSAVARIESEETKHPPIAHVTDGAHLPLGDATVTRVVCTEVLEHVDDPRAFMAELVRIGRPGALYVVTVPGAAQERIQKSLARADYFQKPNHIRIFERDEFHTLIRDAGLAIERTANFGFYWSLWFSFFWQTEKKLGESAPSLDAWAATWFQVLKGRDGLKIKAALDAALPKSEVVVARKPMENRK